MNKHPLVVALIAASGFPAVSLADGLDDVMTALSGGKPSLEMRLRYEQVTDSAKASKADVPSLRTVLGYKTADYQGFTGFVEFENISNFGADNYNPYPAIATPNPVSTTAQKTYPAVADPALTQINQSYLDGYGFRMGRQKVVFDNARFIGDVGWRQNDQTYDGVIYTNKVLIPATYFTLGYLNKVNGINGVTRAVNAPVANVRYSKVFENWGVTASGFYYAIEEETTPAASWKHTGARVEGSVGDALYEVSYVKQGSYKDSTATLDAKYHDIQLGYKLGPVTLKAQQEVLEPGFKTPLATLHAFNGWADRFLATPAKGLEDTNLKLLARYWGLNFVVAAHEFKAQDGGDKFGTEYDVSVQKPVNRNLSLMLKAAQYKGDDNTVTLATVSGNPVKNSDLTKIWAQVGYKF